MNRRDVLVTGEYGLIGFALCQALRRSDRYVLWNDAMESQMTPFKKFTNPFHFYRDKQVRSGEWDVTNEENLDHLVRWLPKGTLIIHAAAYNGTDKCEGWSYEAVKSNVYGTQQMIQLTKAIEGSLLYFSSTSVMDPNVYIRTNGRFTEESEVNPQTIYGLTKWIGEVAIRQSLREDRWLIVRPVFVYGDAPWDNVSMIRRMCQAVALKERATIPLDPWFHKDYFRIEHFIRMIMRLLEDETFGEQFGKVFILSRESPKLFRYYIDLVSLIAGVPVDPYINIQAGMDYLRDHIGVSANFHRTFPDFRHEREAFDDEKGIRKTWESVNRFLEYAR